MIFNRYGQFIALFVLLGLGGFLTGCSENDGKVANTQKSVADVTQLSKEQVVARRAQERWQALIDMDWRKAYELSSPGSRELKPFAVFKKHMESAPMVRKNVAVKSVSCEGDVCSVNLELTYIYMGSIESMRGQETTSIVNEHWLFAEGDWWYAESTAPKGFL